MLLPINNFQLNHLAFIIRMRNNKGLLKVVPVQGQVQKKRHISTTTERKKAIFSFKSIHQYYI